MTGISAAEAVSPDVATKRRPIINDFSMSVASVNGSGSQTANLAMMRAIFKMGVPVSGKNILPSNIQGLPTWFQIRASSKGFTARGDEVNILIAMNKVTFAEDLQNLAPGGVCFYSDDFTLDNQRKDITIYPMPVRKLVRQIDPPRRMREYVANMAYVGVVAQMLGIELIEIRAALEKHFRGKTDPVDLNMSMIYAAANWAKDNLIKQDPFLIQKDNKTEDKILINGNSAAALGAIYGGVSVVAWYPITPASSIVDTLHEFLPQLRRDPKTGKSTCAVIQAEDELAAIGIAIGAGWAGARAMTSTSGPGISLMSEFSGLAFFAEIPIVIWDVQRMGPSTGLPTRTSQGDLLLIRYLGHGDTKHIMLLPSSVGEIFEFGWRAFDIAERLQTPVFVLSDLDLGMNLWMSEPFVYPDRPMDRGKVLTAEDLERIGEFARYRDVDGDYIPYRTIPGTDHPLAAWFARGTGHNEHALYSERPEDWEANMDRLLKKADSARQYIPRPVINRMDGSQIGIIAFGSSDPAVQEARIRLADDIPTDYLRLRALPFTSEVSGFVKKFDYVYVIEMNSDGQMRQMLQMEIPQQAAKFRSLNHNDGLPLTAGWITEALLSEVRG
jgi:2-oxoglutarate ferredoxin oxidoreductase subunit alpha